MNITREKKDVLNAVVKVEISKEDYKEKVENILKDYRKKAHIRGFRKGFVPMGMIQRKYGKAVLAEQVEKLLQSSLNEYVTKEKLNILGNPLPKKQENFSWDNENFTFEFELGLSPDFKVDLPAKDKITKYNVVADQALIEEEIKNITERYGKKQSQEQIEQNSKIRGKVVCDEKKIERISNIALEDIKGKVNQKQFLGKKVGNTLALKTKNLFGQEHKLAAFLGLSQEQIKDLDVQLDFTIEEITTIKPAALNQQLFDKLFAKGQVKDEATLRDRIKEDSEKQFARQTEPHLLNSIMAYLVDNTKFDLPVAFLKKTMQTSSEKNVSSEQITKDFEKTEKALRYQLIESKILEDNNIKVDWNALREYTAGFIKAQMAMYGKTDIEPEELEKMADKMLSNPDEAKRLQTQLTSQRLLAFFKENMTFKQTNLSYEKFIQEAYKK